jgi:hypothetical protein
MSGNQPTTGREVLPAGIDVRKIRGPINDAFRAMPIELTAEGAVTSKDGRRASFSVLGEDLFYIRLDNKTTVNSTVRYGWQAVVQDRDTGNWANSPRLGNHTDDGWAVELNNANLAVGAATRYPARLNPQTGRVTFFQGSGGGGNVEIKSGETVLMILGTYDEYKDCPDVPPKPPTIKTECGEDTGVLCVPAYAYAVYTRCGYVWNKVGDTRTFGVWANELNGGTASATRRLYVPRWGGDIDPETGLPEPDSFCMGVAFMGYTSQGSLTCTCPTCLSSPPPDSCLVVKFKTPPRPCPRPPSGDITCGFGCPDAFDAMDASDAWDKDFMLKIDPLGCTAGAVTTDGLFDFEWQFIQQGFLSCDWGPDVFDPCAPCRHWGRLAASIGINGEQKENCGGAGVWTGEFLTEEICKLLCDCGDPVKPFDQVICNACQNSDGVPFNFVIPESIEIECCPDEIDGGESAGSPPEGIVDGNGDGLSFDGGDA